MECIQSLEKAKNLFPQGCVVCIGNFDGLHLGHQRLLQVTVEEAQSLGVPSVLLSFTPHPQNFFSSNSLPLLMSDEEKKQALSTTGIDFSLFLPFNNALASLSPEGFVQTVLYDIFHCKCLCTGYDYRFGKNREGGEATLNKLAQKYHFKSIRIPPLKIDGKNCSSSTIRRLLLAGETLEAQKFLGQPYSLQGLVIHGKGRGGKLLGFPTANVQVEKEKLIPAVAVYAGMVKLCEKASYSSESLKALISIGDNPTFGDNAVSIEVHILDFSRDIYGTSIALFFAEKLRRQIRFDGTEKLIQQITDDIHKARALWAHTEL